MTEGKIRKLGSRIVEQVMNSGTSARIAGLLALGNQVTSNSSACSTGTEAIVEGMWRIRMGLAGKKMRWPEAPKALRPTSGQDLIPCG